MIQRYLDRKPARNIKSYQKLGGAFKCLGLIAFGAILLDTVLYGMAWGIHGIYAGIAMAAIILGCNFEGYERPASQASQHKPAQVAPPVPAQTETMTKREAVTTQRWHLIGNGIRTLGFTTYGATLLGLVTNWEKLSGAEHLTPTIVVIATFCVVCAVGGAWFEARNSADIVERYGSHYKSGQ